MKPALAMLAALLSVLFLPHVLTMAVAVGASFFSPLAPLAAGLLADALFYTPQSYPMPFYTLLGAATSAAALLVRSFVETSIMR